ncbi:MAG: glycoside hydrolase family 3 protein [Acidobacteriota bacterium]|nr:glycoside hydrolase family 3 protein [Acidobacteriota bacterium]
MGATRGRRKSGRLLAGMALWSLASCSGPAPGPSAAGGPSTSRPQGPPTAATDTIAKTAEGAAAGGPDGRAAFGTVGPPATCLAASEVAGWSLSRRAALLVVVPVLDGDPAAIAVATRAGAGGVLLIGPQPGPAALTATLSPLHRSATPPPLVMADEEGGGVERLAGDVPSLPWPQEMASTMTPAAVQSAARNVGAAMKALGVTVDLAPVLDLDAGPVVSKTDPDGPRSFSARPATAGEYGSAFVAGLAQAGVLGVLKHFPGLGGSSGNTDYEPAATTPLAQLLTGGLVPFEQDIRAGAAAVMVANASVPGLTPGPASLSPAVIEGLLEQQIHFHGLVLTDSLSAGAVSAAGFDLPAAAVAAVGAGADMVLFGSTLTAADTARLAPGPLASDVSGIVAAIVAAVQNAQLSQPRLDQAVLQVMRARGAELCPGS